MILLSAEACNVLCLYCSQCSCSSAFCPGSPWSAMGEGEVLLLCFCSKTGQGKKQWKPQHCLCVALLLCELCACIVWSALKCRMWAAFCSPFCCWSMNFWHWFTLHPGNTSDCWSGRLHTNSGFLQSGRNIQTNKLPKTASAEFRTGSLGLFPVGFWKPLRTEIPILSPAWFNSELPSYWFFFFFIFS